MKFPVCAITFVPLKKIMADGGRRETQNGLDQNTNNKRQNDVDSLEAGAAKDGIPHVNTQAVEEEVNERPYPNLDDSSDQNTNLPDENNGIDEEDSLEDEPSEDDDDGETAEKQFPEMQEKTRLLRGFFKRCSEEQRTAMKYIEAAIIARDISACTSPWACAEQFNLMLKDEEIKKHFIAVLAYTEGHEKKKRAPLVEILAGKMVSRIILQTKRVLTIKTTNFIAGGTSIMYVCSRKCIDEFNGFGVPEPGNIVENAACKVSIRFNAQSKYVKTKKTTNSSLNGRL